MKFLKKVSREKLVDAALGRIPFDLVIKNVKIVNVISGEIYPGEVGIIEGYISYVSANPDGEFDPMLDPLKGKSYYDAEGKYLIPGFIDSHLHIESTMLTPRRFAEIAIPSGTTTVVTDPHEIANVYGVDGVKYMHDSSSNIPMRQFILASPCIPAVFGMENSGATFRVKEIEELLKLERVIGIAEVMDFIGVINHDSRMSEILNMAIEKNLYITGHAPELSGRALSAYLNYGPNSDHETRRDFEAKEKYRYGMFVDSREGSISKNVKSIYEGLKNFRYYDRMTLCTDDMEVENILEHGHVSSVVRKAITYGMNPIDAIRCGTLNAAREIGYRDLGAIAPGFIADLVVVDSLENLNASGVFYEGKLVAANGELLEEINKEKFEIENKNSINIHEIKKEDLILKAPIENGKIKTNILTYKSKSSAATLLSTEELEVKDYKIDIAQMKDLRYCAVVNRYGRGNISLGFVKDFGNEIGTMASTVSHDSHNLVLVYDTPENALVAIKEIHRVGGGMTCIVDGKVKTTLALPVAGLMSNIPGAELAKQALAMKNTLIEIGITETENPLLRIATLALPVIPDVKMSDMGLIDVRTQKFIPIFEK